MKSLVFFFLLFLNFTYAQITINATFDDWDDILTIEDSHGEIEGLDILNMSITNDEEYLYIRFEVDDEMSLQSSSYSGSTMTLSIDTDSDEETGWVGEPGIGSELTLEFGNRNLYFDYPEVGNYEGILNDLSVKASPTITGSEFEIAISRLTKPDGINDAFLGDTIHLLLYSSDEDRLPDEATSIEYVFEDGPFEEYEPIDIHRVENTLRLMVYNTLFDGLTEADQVDHFRSIIQALDPDVIVFNETNNTEAEFVVSLLQDWIPFVDWYAEKSLSRVITASRFPFLFAGQVEQEDTRSLASLIDLPDELYTSNLLVVNSHYSCCSNDASRQEQVNNVVDFIQGSMDPNNAIGVKEGDAIINAGDFNFVGWKKQLETLISEDLKDWDGENFKSAECLHTHQAMHYTWRNLSSSFTPGKLDYIVYSESSINIENAFVLETEQLPEEVLEEFNLDSLDTYFASDHLPVVVDMYLNRTTSTGSTESLNKLNVFPNPASEFLSIDNLSDQSLEFSLDDHLGHSCKSGVLAAGQNEFFIKDLAPGLYFLNTSEVSIKVIITRN